MTGLTSYLTSSGTVDAWQDMTLYQFLLLCHSDDYFSSGVS